jgi:hypothetical protein
VAKLPVEDGGPVLDGSAQRQADPIHRLGADAAIQLVTA